jgi:hypothetical protein
VIISGNSVTLNDIRNIKSIKRKNIAVANTPLCLEATKEGIKACVNAPSANILLNRLGSLKAIKNISVYIEAPRADAIITSRPKPVIRENRIPKLLVNIDFNFIGLFFCYNFI